MLSAAELLTRWPRLDVAERHARLRGTVRATPGALAPRLATLTDRATRASASVWARDASLWASSQIEQHRIAQRLGWLDAPALMADALDRLTQFAERARADGFTHAVLLGMGGSSLAPEVMRAIIGTRPGWLQLHVLDSTDPAAVLAIDTPASQTLVIVASKSGTTIEPVSLALAFRDRLVRAGVERWAGHFVAITDADTELAVQARTEGFRDAFINPSDIGGRYSALSFFGLVPAALMGHDLAALVGWGLAELADAAPDASVPDRRAVTLGSVMAAGAREGRDKVTLLAPEAYAPLGLWIEQLVAESTGKRGVGLVPIAGESPTTAARYGSDRLFVRLSPARASTVPDPLTSALREAGHPVIEVTIPEVDALGAEFVRWEMATAIAAALLDINPFDEPNVAQAKEATGQLLREYRTSGRLPARPPDRVLPGGIDVHATRALRAGAENPLAIVSRLTPGDYFALLAYLGPDVELARALHRFRTAVGDATGAATMFGYGPRYLHSTGQLHKGGANNGVFVLISADPERDVEIPGQGLTFGTLELAQALGDFASLDATDRRALHVHLPRPDGRLIADVAATVMRDFAPLARE